MRFEGPCRASIVESPRPVVAAPGEALVQVRISSIGPADLERYAAQRALRGDRTPAGDTIPGGACAGVVEATGDGVRRWRPGDAVVVPAAVPAGAANPPGPPGGAVFGRDLPGSHAGWMRVPAADRSLLALPDPPGLEAQAVLAADAFGIGARAARLAASARPGAVCVVGCDAACLAFIAAWKQTRGRHGDRGIVVAADSAPGRVMLARRMGATGVVLRGEGSDARDVRDGASRGSFDAVIVGSKVEGASLELARELAAPDAPVALLDPPGTGWSTPGRDSLTGYATRCSVTGFAEASEVDEHLAALRAGTLDLLPFISHTFPLPEAAAAYAAAYRKDRGVLKVLLKP